MSSSLVALSSILSEVSGAVLWGGRFSSSSLTTIGSWSWSNQQGPYQYHIHGAGAVFEYLSTSATYRNPAAKDDVGLKPTIDSTAKWNSDMLRTELIP
ncbi:hypothetical protein BDZ45DRAFT_722400 [Acephala macrosclerotiorum]|nr:hypothetical protein BDZ45DRAFT_722400 [Acephala macrosclerotiorum]